MYVKVLISCLWTLADASSLNNLSMPWKFSSFQLRRRVAYITSLLHPAESDRPIEKSKFYFNSKDVHGINLNEKK